MLSRVSIRRNPLYYIVFGSKHISLSHAKKKNTLNEFKRPPDQCAL